MSEHDPNTRDDINIDVDIQDAEIHGDVNIIGKMVEIIKHPAQWQDIVFRFFSAHRVILIVTAVAQVLLLALYWLVKDVYLVPVWGWAVSAALLMVAIWTWYTWARFGRAPVRLALAAISTAGFALLLGWQGWQITHPTPFVQDVFGIAVAEIGQEGVLARTAVTREISREVWEKLCEDIRLQYLGEQAQDPCLPVEEADDERRYALQRIGVMNSKEMAQAQGSAINADIVIWGRLLRSEDGNVSLRFEVLETLDQAVNPDFPIVMPVTMTSTELFTNVASPGQSDGLPVKEAAGQQAIIISLAVQGLLSFLERDFPEALLRLEGIARRVEANPDISVPPEGLSLLYYYLARANHHLGVIDEGQAWLLEAQELNGEEPAVPISLALGYGSLGDFERRDQLLDDALDKLDDHLISEPGDAAALYDRALVLEIQRNYPAAMIGYERLLEVDPEFYIGYIQLGLVTYEAEGIDAAIPHFENGIKLAEQSGTNPAWAYQRMAIVYDKAGQQTADAAQAQAYFDSARSNYEQAIARQPNVDRMYLPYAEFLERQQEMDAALAAYQKLTEISHQPGWAFEQLADFYKRRGLYEEAARNYVRAIVEQPRDPLLHTELGDTYRRLGRFDDARAAFETAVDTNAAVQSYYVYAMYGNFEFGQGNWAHAIELYEASLALRPVDFPVRMNLGQVLDGQGRLEEAAVHYCFVLQNDGFGQSQRDLARDRLAANGLDGTCE